MDNKTISREELEQRLQKLAEHDRAALSVFAARCALRVLLYTAEKVILISDGKIGMNMCRVCLLPARWR